MTQEPKAQSGEPTTEELLKLCDAVDGFGLYEPHVLMHKARTVARSLKSRLSDQGQATREQIAEHLYNKYNLAGIRWDVLDAAYKREWFEDADAILSLSPVEPRPQPDAAAIRKAALEEAETLLYAKGDEAHAAGGTDEAVVWHWAAQAIRPLITADKQEGG